MVERKTTVALKRATVDRLSKYGHMRESYDLLINRLLDERDQAGVLNADCSSH